MFKNKHEAYIPIFCVYLNSQNILVVADELFLISCNSADDFSYHFMWIYKIVCSTITILSMYRCLILGFDG